MESAALESVISKATPEQRRYLVHRLLAKEIEETGYKPVPVTDESGQTVGYYIPWFRSAAKAPPKLSPERRAELDRRLNNLDESISQEEMMKRLGLADLRPPKQ